jgi:hypothetical protein
LTAARLSTSSLAAAKVSLGALRAERLVWSAMLSGARQIAAAKKCGREILHYGSLRSG